MNCAAQTHFTRDDQRVDSSSVWKYSSGWSVERKYQHHNYGYAVFKPPRIWLDLTSKASSSPAVWNQHQTLRLAWTGLYFHSCSPQNNCPPLFQWFVASCKTADYLCVVSFITCNQNEFQEGCGYHKLNINSKLTRVTEPVAFAHQGSHNKYGYLWWGKGGQLTGLTIEHIPLPQSRVTGATNTINPENIWAKPCIPAPNTKTEWHRRKGMVIRWGCFNLSDVRWNTKHHLQF